jgi:hypothetical protein
MYSTVRKFTSYNNIGMPGLAGMLANREDPSTAGMTAKAETPATAGMKATAGKPTTPGTPTKAYIQATVRTSETKKMPAAASNIRHTLISRRATNSNGASNNSKAKSRDARKNTDANNSQVFAEIRKNSSELQNFAKKYKEKMKSLFFVRYLSASPIAIGSPVLLARYLKSDSFARPIFRLFFLSPITIGKSENRNSMGNAHHFYFNNLAVELS